MTSDNDKKAAEEYAHQEDVWHKSPPVLTIEHFLAGCTYKEQQARAEVIEEVRQSLKAKQEMSHSMETNILSGSVRMSVIFEVLNDLLKEQP